MLGWDCAVGREISARISEMSTSIVEVDLRFCDFGVYDQTI